MDSYTVSYYPIQAAVVSVTKYVRVPVRTQLFSGRLALITNVTNHFKKSGQWDEKRERKKQKLIQRLIPSPKLAMPKSE